MSNDERTPAQRIADETDAAIAAITGAPVRVSAATQAPKPMDADIRDSAMRQLWLASGGTFHDVYEARGYMPQRRLLDFLWLLVTDQARTVAIRQGEIVLEPTSGFLPTNEAPAPRQDDGIDPTPPPPPNGDAGPHPTPPHAPPRGKPGPKPKSK